ncbi:MAG: hypothetical protein QNJ22_22590 [Desulfosarcinaceae bacterium]|nr:hypothetical protein [Desulfosarcinaceae bacterium]
MEVGIYRYDQTDVLDVAGPFEVFSTASRISEADPLTVFLVGETGKPVQARGGFTMLPAYGFHTPPAIDLLIVPDGCHLNKMQRPAVSWMASTRPHRHQSYRRRLAALRRSLRAPKHSDGPWQR